ncbi:MAG: YdcF family protein [bacterium]
MANQKGKNILKLFMSALKRVVMVAGIIATTMFILALTSAPFWIWYGLGVKKAGIHRPPDYIVVMGGGGMPSESGLMRCWYAAKAANHFSRSKVIIALPGDVKDPMSSVNQMKKELELRGICADRIFLEDSGTNTRDEALRVWKIIQNSKCEEQNAKSNSGIITGSLNKDELSPGSGQRSLLIVTSPEHLYRAVLTFNKIGFIKVDGIPAFEKTIEADLSFSAKKLGSRSWVPDIGQNITIRYRFWMYLDYEFLVLREWLAMAYYKLQGWI